MRLKVSLYFFAILFGGVSYSAELLAQATDSAFVNKQLAENSHPVITSGNPAGLQYFPVNGYSYAQVFAEKQNGPFINYYQSDNSRTLGAMTESYKRINQRIIFKGRIAYENFTGKHMGGSVFIDPYKNPLNIVENADSTAGTKKTEQYNLLGAVSTRIGSRLNIGASVDYTAANYTKIKDLRHTNSLLDIEARTGFNYRINRLFDFGASYTYNRRIESVAFKTYGNLDRQYLSLVDFGAFFGQTELHELNGYTGSSTTKPIVNISHSGTAQLLIKLTPSLSWFHEFTYTSRSGYYGKKGNTNIIYTEHEATGYQYNSSFALKQTNSLHTLKIGFNTEDLVNRENIFRSETNSGGNNRIVYYGQNDKLNQKTNNISVNYTAFLQINNLNPVWVLQAGGIYASADKTVTMYPFYRNQLIRYYRISADALRNLIVRKNMYSFSIGLLYGKGNGTMKEDGLYATPSSSQRPPASREKYLQQEFEYLTRPRFSVSPAVKFSRPVQKNITGYCGLQYQYTQTFSAGITGNEHNVWRLTVGCTF